MIKIEANRQRSFHSARQWYEDLQPAESRYKVEAKPVPYKPPQPAPSHFEGVLWYAPKHKLCSTHPVIHVTLILFRGL